MDNSLNGNGINVSYEKKKNIDSKSPSDHLDASQQVKNYSLKWLEGMEAKYKKINALLKQAENIQSKSSTAQSKALEEQKNILKEQLLVMDKMKVTGSATVEQQLEVDKQIAEVWEELSKKQLKVMQDSGKLTKRQEANLLNAKKQAQDMNKATKESIKDIEKALKNIESGNWFDKANKSLNEFSKELMNIANTQNINKIAETLTGGNIDDKIAIRNNTKASFGMSSNREFEEFKNGLMQSTQDLNKTVGQAMFGAKDVRTYMSKLTKMGIDSTKLAQQQLQATLIGNKYLGLSDESQTMMIEQIKKNGDNTLMTKQNNRIVALLNSQIGLSKEQLDSITKSKMDNADAIANLGPEAYEKYMSTFDAGQAALSAAFGDNVAKSVNNIFSDLLLNGTSSSYIQNGSFGNAYGMLSSVQSGDYQGFINQLMNDSHFKSIMDSLSTNNNSGEIRQQLGITGDMSSVYNAFFGKNRDLYGKKLNEANNAVGGASDEQTKEFLSKQVVSWTDQLKNTMSLTFDKLPWGLYFNLANTAFSLYIATKSWDVIKGLGKNINSIVKFFSGGKGIGTLLTGGKGLSGLLAKGKGVAETGYLKALYAGDAIKAGGSSILKTLATGLGKGGLTAGGASTAVAATAGIAGGLYGLYAMGKDAIGGVNKAKEWTGSDSTGAKVASGIGGALGGTGPGLFDEGSAGDKAKNIGGGALKGAGIGAAIGSIIPGLGTAVGAAIGAGVGAVGSAIGGEKITKAIKGVGDFASKTFKKAGETFIKATDKGVEAVTGVTEKMGPAAQVFGRNIASTWENAKESASAIGDIWSDDTKSFGEKLTGTIGEAGNFIKKNWTDSWKNFQDVGKETWSKVSDWGKDKINKIKNGWKETWDKCKEWGKKAMSGINDYAQNNDNWIAKGLKWLGFGKSGGVDRTITGRYGIGGNDRSYGGYSVTSPYGPRIHPISGKYKMHTGIDLGIPSGVPLGAAISGKVVQAGSNGGYGNSVMIKGDDGKYRLYAHLSSVNTKVGAQVQAGDLIGKVGSTGNSTGPHLHYEVRNTSSYGSDIDPTSFINSSIFNIGDKSGAVYGSFTTLNNGNETSYNTNKASSSISTIANLNKKTRYIPKAYGGQDKQIAGFEQASNAAADKIIAKLDELSARQDEQAAMIQAFSMSNSTPKEFGGAYS